MDNPTFYITTVVHGRIVSQQTVSSARPSARSVLHGEDQQQEIYRRLSEIPEGQPFTIWLGRPFDNYSGTLYSLEPCDQEDVNTELARAGTGAQVRTQLVMCLARGTFIRTEDGERQIEHLEVGDQIVTLDDGLQTLRWIGSRRVHATGDMLPIRLSKDAFRKGSPHVDLLVSPKHRVVISGWQAEVLFGQEEVLCTARSLVNGDNIHPATDLREVEYYHLMFDKHQLIYANNALTESFNPSEVVMDEIDAAVRDEILSIFPELRDNPGSYGPSVRMVVSGKEARLIWDS